MNLYGARDNFDPDSSHLIPALIRKCVEAKERGDDRITVWGTGNTTWESLYVEDAAEGILLAADPYNGGDPVNLCSGMEVSVKDLVTPIAELTSFDASIIWDTNEPDGPSKRNGRGS